MGGVSGAAALMAKRQSYSGTGGGESASFLGKRSGGDRVMATLDTTMLYRAPADEKDSLREIKLLRGPNSEMFNDGPLNPQFATHYTCRLSPDEIAKRRVTSSRRTAPNARITTLPSGAQLDINLHVRQYELVFGVRGRAPMVYSQQPIEDVFSSFNAFDVAHYGNTETAHENLYFVGQSVDNWGPNVSHQPDHGFVAMTNTTTTVMCNSRAMIQAGDSVMYSIPEPHRFPYENGFISNIKGMPSDKLLPILSSVSKFSSGSRIALSLTRMLSRSAPGSIAGKPIDDLLRPGATLTPGQEEALALKRSLLQNGLDFVRALVERGFITIAVPPSFIGARRTEAMQQHPSETQTLAQLKAERNPVDQAEKERSLLWLSSRVLHTSAISGAPSHVNQLLVEDILRCQMWNHITDPAVRRIFEPRFASEHPAPLQNNDDGGYNDRTSRAAQYHASSKNAVADAYAAFSRAELATNARIIGRALNTCKPGEALHVYLQGR